MNSVLRFIIEWLPVFFVVFLLALPGLKSGPAERNLLVGMGIVCFGILLPFFIFFTSPFLVPTWKGASKFGALDCFIVGKTALTPIILLAVAALYKAELVRDTKPDQRWVVLGLFLGSVVSGFCFLFGLVCFSHRGLTHWLLVPLCVSVWHGTRAYQLGRQAPFGLWTYLSSLIATIPLWIWSWLWSKETFSNLPDTAPENCFVVTAAGHGHPGLVGPFTEFSHGGRRLPANGQLITFWTFEDRWRARFPRSHRLFRRVYNRLGPHLARRIRSPWLADLVWLLLKPLELLAKLACGR